MISDYFKLAVRNLKKRKLRSSLTLIGIFISIAIIFLLISISIGLEQAVTEQFRALGTDKFFIQPKGQLAGPGTSGAVQLTLKDADRVERISGVKDLSYATLGNGEVEYAGQKRYVMVAGVPLDRLTVFEEISSYKIDEGRFIREGDEGSVMIGSQYKSGAFFAREVGSGDRISINGEEFRVRGILQTLGNPADDRMIYMSFSDFKGIFNSSERLDQIFVQINLGENLREVADRTEKALARFRGVDADNPDFTILTPEELLESFGTVLNILTAFLLGVAGISLLVGSIGIANTMYTSVLERTREIGIMKAVGAQNKDILFLFVTESGLLGFIGGFIGVMLGFIGAKVLEYIVVNQLDTTLLRAATPYYLFLGCLIFSFLIGAVSGAWPAWRATKIKPVEALRYE